SSRLPPPAVLTGLTPQPEGGDGTEDDGDAAGGDLAGGEVVAGRAEDGESDKEQEYRAQGEDRGDVAGVGCPAVLAVAGAFRGHPDLEASSVAMTSSTSALNTRSPSSRSRSATVQPASSDRKQASSLAWPG